jgi:ribonuclease BN (tRNA processing enzyme)
VRLTVLGCSGTFPGPTSPCSGYLFEHDGYRLMVDAGNGVLGALQARCDLRAVDAVLLSHLHGDHCLDMVPWAYARRYHPEGLPPRLPVYGPAGTRDRLCAAFDRPPEDRLGAVYDFRTARRGPLELGPFCVELAQMNHPVECYGIRVSAGGRSVAYSADTGESEALVRLAQDSDLLLCEASFLDGWDNPPNVHLTGRQAGEHAARAGARSLLLTHIVPWADPARLQAEAAAVYPGELDVAAAGRVVEL